MEKKIFLKLDGVRGQSENPRHYGEIELTGMWWGGDNQLNSCVGSGRVGVNDVTVIKKADKSSPLLFLARNRAQAIKTGVITVEEFAEWKSVVRTTRIEMYSVLVSTFLSDFETDSIGLNFAEVKMFT
ncbi:MAG: type VI secretion system tube protein Hcp [Pyrinomonadaceae bacterium]